MVHAVYTSAMKHATVIATYSRRMRIRLANAVEVDARIKGKRLKPVCGDHVDAEPIENESDWLITRIAKRRNELTRPNMRGQVEVLAANLDYLVVVAAIEPKADWFIVDRYLCAAELMGIGAGIVQFDAFVDFTLLDLGGNQPDGRQARLVLRPHGILHILLNAFLEGHAERQPGRVSVETDAAGQFA